MQVLEGDVTTVVRDVITRTGDVNEERATLMSTMSGTVSSSGGAASASRYDATRCRSQPLKPAKKYRSESDGDKQIVRCKRKLDFIGDEVDSGGTTKSGGHRGRASSGGARRAASVARRNERERKRVSLINRTFEILRDQLPASLWGHRNLAKVSKVETLRAAIGYIRTLEDLLATDDGGAEDDGHLVEMLSSAERLASLAGDDGRVDVAQISSSPILQFSTHPSQPTFQDAAASDCERLEYLSSCTPTTHVDLHSATRRLARLTAPTHSAVTQQPFYDVTSDFAGPGSLEPDDDGSLFLDINSNYDNVRQPSSLKPADDDVIRQLVGDNFVFDNIDFSTTVGS